ncbi:MAG TPA: DUF4468 domain-containing protein [Bacteroidia bacterium]|nr:DUF4468 domain-containing protein [Bacteroidia bacterium]
MKKLLTILFLTTWLQINAQTTLPTDSATGRITFTEVVKVDSTAASELYSRAKIWFGETFNSAQSVIQTDDANSKTIVGKGGAVYYMNGLTGEKFNAGTIHYMIKVEAKDNRYKYTITDFDVQTKYASSTVEDYNNTKKQKQKLYDQVQTIGDGLSTSLKNSLSKTSSSAKSNW